MTKVLNLIENNSKLWRFLWNLSIPLKELHLDILNLKHDVDGERVNLAVFMFLYSLYWWHPLSINLKLEFV